eukprot:4493729-Amphidinium_carterae.1
MVSIRLPFENFLLMASWPFIEKTNIAGKGKILVYIRKEEVNEALVLPVGPVDTNGAGGPQDYAGDLEYVNGDEPPNAEEYVGIDTWENAIVNHVSMLGLNQQLLRAIEFMLTRSVGKPGPVFGMTGPSPSRVSRLAKAGATVRLNERITAVSAERNAVIDAYTAGPAPLAAEPVPKAPPNPAHAARRSQTLWITDPRDASLGQSPTCSASGNKQPAECLVGYTV